MIMKKQFFYAAMALAVMSSCSKDNDPGNGNPEESNDRAVIALGVDAPAVTANTRGTGSVGDVDGVNNKWDSQRLYIHMVDKETGLEAEEADGTKIFDNTALEFRAPRKDAADDNIRIYQTGSITDDKGTIQYKYYPTNGTYTFYGYHVDDAAHDDATITADTKTVTGVTINGTQDLLSAKTIALRTEDATETDSPYYDFATHLPTSDTWANLVQNYQFGARTARNNIIPVLKFTHQLARLKFFVRAGDAKAAAKKWNTVTSQWDENADGANKLGMQVTKIMLTEMVSKVDMDLENGTSAKNGDATDNFTVCQKNAVTGQLEAITSVIPTYPHGNANIPSSDPDKNGTPIGEPVLFFPDGDVTLSIDLKQYVVDTEDENNGGTKTYKEVTKEGQKLVVYQNKINTDAADGTDTFKPGYSYNVYITIYGLQDIRVSAVLTAWEEGGDINTDIEDGK